MNYRDYFRKEAVSAQLKDAPKGEVNSTELEKGIKVEMEHTTDRSTAETIARHHLAEDPKYYSHMDAAGLKECGIDDNGGLPKCGGALAIPHVGQPIHMSKIIQVGPSLGGPATGELSGFTAAGGDKKGVAADKGGVKVGKDSEPITAGGQSVDSNIASKTVGGPVTANKGEKQGGPNSQGTYADTPKLDGGMSAMGLEESHKKAIRNIVKEVLKEITFNKKTGKWERLNEYGFARNNPDPNWHDYHGGGGRMDNLPPPKASSKPSTTLPKGSDSNPTKDPIDSVDRSGDFGEIPGETPIGEELNMKMGPSYKGPAGRQYRTSDDDQARKVEYEPEITEMYDEEEAKKMDERYNQLMTQQRLLTEKENTELKTLKERKERMENLRNFGASVGGVEPNLYEDQADMKMGASYRVGNQPQYRTVDSDTAHRNQDTPESTNEAAPTGVEKDECMQEAGGAAVQNRSARVANDAPQIVKNRHKGDIDESTDYLDARDPDRGGFVSAGLKQLFQSGKTPITVDDVDQVGMGHIKDPDVAGEYATKLAWDIANDYGYTYDENREAFIKTGKKWDSVTAPLQETEKKSSVVKAIQRGTKGKRGATKQVFKYKGGKSTKSGVHKEV